MRGMGYLNGVADILGIYNGKLLAIEVKRPGQKPTELQDVFLARIKEHGGIAFVATSIKDVAKRLNLPM